MTTLHGTTTTRPFIEPGTVLLAYLGDDLVPKDHRADVDDHVWRLSHRHGLPPIRVRYYGRPYPGVRFEDCFTYEVPGPPTPESGISVHGFAPSDQPWTIVLDGGIRGPIIEAVIAHEVRHCMQLWGDVDVPQAERELDADRFAERALARA